MNFPEFQMPISYPRVGQDEAVWLRRYNDAGGVARWILLDERATPRGELELPTNVRILWSRGDNFWAVVPDEFDVPWVVRYRIEGG
jgi:hypothetical protein